jgi:hypothetical protein
MHVRGFSVSVCDDTREEWFQTYDMRTANSSSLERFCNLTMADETKSFLSLSGSRINTAIHFTSFSIELKSLSGREPSKDD